MSKPLEKNDPAYWMLEQGRKDPSKRSTTTVYMEGCYICEDPEFALMGLPLCKPCFDCGGHIAADDCICNKCGSDDREFITIKVEVSNPKDASTETWQLWGKQTSADDVEFRFLQRDKVRMDYDEFMAVYVVDGSEIDQWHALLKQQRCG
jgi:hypothetical protein